MADLGPSVAEEPAGIIRDTLHDPLPLRAKAKPVSPLRVDEETPSLGGFPRAGAMTAGWVITVPHAFPANGLTQQSVSAFWIP